MDLNEILLVLLGFIEKWQTNPQKAEIMPVKLFEILFALISSEDASQSLACLKLTDILMQKFTCNLGHSENRRSFTMNRLKVESASSKTVIRILFLEKLCYWFNI